MENQIFLYRAAKKTGAAVLAAGLALAFSTGVAAAAPTEGEMLAESISFDLISAGPQSPGSLVLPKPTLEGWKAFTQGGKLNPRDLKISYVRADGTEVQVPGETNGLPGCKGYDPAKTDLIDRCLGTLPKGEIITIKVDPASIPEGWHLGYRGWSNYPSYPSLEFKHEVGGDNDANGGVNFPRISFMRHNIEFMLLGGTLEGSTANVTRIVNRDNTVDFPADPVKEGMTFLGWYTFNSGQEKNSYIPLQKNPVLTPGGGYVAPSWAISGKSAQGFDTDQVVWTPQQRYSAETLGEIDWNDPSFDPNRRDDPKTILRAQWGVQLSYDFNGGKATQDVSADDVAPVTYAPQASNVSYPSFPEPSFTIKSAEDFGLSWIDHTFQGWKALDNGKPVGELIAAGEEVVLKANMVLQAQWEFNDADGDGIGDSADKCADTPSGLAVDSNGCALSQINKPVYPGGTTVKQDDSKTVPAPTFDNPSTDEVETNPAPAGTTYEKADGAPEWVKVNPDGSVTVAPHEKVALGTYTIPVKVTYPNNGGEAVAELVVKVTEKDKAAVPVVSQKKQDMLSQTGMGNIFSLIACAGVLSIAGAIAWRKALNR